MPQIERRQETILVQMVAQQLLQHWDDKLSPSDHNLHPLAPRDLVKLGLVTDVNYAEQNALWTRFCSSLMEVELASIIKQQSRGLDPVAELFGPGLLRDLDWVIFAMNNGFKLRLRDVSTVAQKLVQSRFAPFIADGRLEMFLGEIQGTLYAFPVDLRHTVAYFASKFIQVQQRKRMHRLLRKVGYLLRRSSCEGAVKPVLFLVHPFGTDNEGPREWEGHLISSVEWGDTRPYEQEEIREAIQKGALRRPVQIEVLGKHFYFHQCYSFLKVTLSV